ncbi:ATP synthase subunit d, mitochondrial [Pseudolycoriella hygida]|uniref:ATP synthase subunit d, mitochondrial n=1 Tax=Pseudolycoriella hygida TaxID=35572 RepID=A0A9Q0MPK8_9DIPT|nr:ATP synthase subunit d, mitochondrial [Pseudolycoriella hygida]
MAAKRISSSSINWSAIAERVQPSQRLNFNQFKSKSDKYLRRQVINQVNAMRVTANPESAPKIDWAYYKSRIAVPGLVDTFQKNYESIKIPYPPDNLTSQVVAQEGQLKIEIQQFKAASNARIAEIEKSIKHLQSLLPFEEMTLEDYRDAFPDQALDPINRPTFWPHNPEEQLDYYKDDDKAGHSAH